ncbi:MAG TPA: ORF6N domain-containing protein, partial [Flavobacteriales bacterium]|nr:ORF6N domain-containing protein [Flavobacteriales bacterium]
MEPKALYGLDLPADGTVAGHIHVIRGQKVMLDRDLAELYGLPVKQLKQAVRRHMERFPEDFMFELTMKEAENSRSQFVTLNQERPEEVVGNERVSRSQTATLKQGQNIKYLPFAFTEHGILMLANVLRSERAIAVSIHIIRVFARMREVLLSHREILQKLEQLEGRVTGHDEEIQALFDHLTALASPTEQPRRAIG